MKIVEYQGQYRITLPKTLVLDKGWKAGTEIRFIEDIDGRVFIRELQRRKKR